MKSIPRLKRRLSISLAVVRISDPKKLNVMLSLSKQPSCNGDLNEAVEMLRQAQHDRLIIDSYYHNVSTRVASASPLHNRLFVYYPRTLVW